MNKILVSGLLNLETTCKVDKFPIEYTPIDYNFFGVNSYPAGVGFNISLALNKLGDDVKLLSFVGNDSSGEIVTNELKKKGVVTDYLMNCDMTPSSLVLYDNSGMRKIYCDLKDIQEKTFDKELFYKAVQDCDALILCNINFSRELLTLAKDFNKIIATDVHCLSDINDEYNKDFIEKSDIVFLSNEYIIGREEDFVRQLKDNYPCKIFVVGMGDKGSLIYQRENDLFTFVESYKDINVKNTVGAGDALLSSFIHFYVKGYDPITALKYANKFAALKITEYGAAKGFVSEEEIIN